MCHDNVPLVQPGFEKVVLADLWLLRACMHTHTNTMILGTVTHDNYIM